MGKIGPIHNLIEMLFICIIIIILFGFIFYAIIYYSTALFSMIIIITITSRCNREFQVGTPKILYVYTLKVYSILAFCN